MNITFRCLNYHNDQGFDSFLISLQIKLVFRAFGFQRFCTTEAYAIAAPDELSSDPHHSGGYIDRQEAGQKAKPEYYSFRSSISHFGL